MDRWTLRIFDDTGLRKFSDKFGTLTIFMGFRTWAIFALYLEGYYIRMHRQYNMCVIHTAIICALSIIIVNYAGLVVRYLYDSFKHLDHYIILTYKRC